MSYSGILKQQKKDASWEDHQITEDIIGPISSPPVELKVIGQVVPAKLEPRHGYSEVWISPLGYEGESPAGDYIVKLDSGLNGTRVGDLTDRTLYYVPLLDETDDDCSMLQSLLLEMADVEMGRFRRIGILKSLSTEARDFYLRN